MITERMQQLAGVRIEEREERVDESLLLYGLAGIGAGLVVGTGVALFANALAYLVSKSPHNKYQKDGFVKGMIKTAKAVKYGSEVTMEDMEAVRERFMKQINALPGNRRGKIKHYLTRLENMIKSKQYSRNTIGKAEMGDLVMKIADEIERLGLLEDE